MSSLKLFFPALSAIIGMTSDELYNRQRALVACGVLQSVAGRGPGSGVRLSEDTVAGLLIGLLSADSLADTDYRIKSVCDAEPHQYFTGEPAWNERFPTFRTAVSAMLSGSLTEVESIGVTRWESAEIRRHKGRPKVLDFYFSFRERKRVGEPTSTVFKTTRVIEAIHLDRVRWALHDFLKGAE
jgi:hypothetical protein